MLSPTDIINVFFDQWYFYLFFSCFFSLILALTVKKISLGFFDPVHFFWSFTFGTSYSVILLLFFNGFISLFSIFLILFYFLVLIVSIYLGFYSKIINFNFYEINNECSYKDLNSLLTLLFLFYFALIFYYILNIDWSIFFLSRFEANKGLGYVARILDILRLFIISILSLLYFKRDGKFNLYFFLLVSMILVSSFFNGAKFSILESLYLVVVLYCLYNKKLIKFNFKNSINSVFMLVGVVFFALYFTSKLAKSLDYNSQYTNLPIAFEMLLSRIIANGDIYYLGLINNLVFKLSDNVSGFFELIFRPYLGSNLTQIIFSVNSENESLNIGRVVWEYWFPYSVSGGSVDHFDIAAYAYFGFVGGVFFVILLGFSLGRINKYKYIIMNNRISFLNLCFFSILYIKCYSLLLSPIVGITTIIDISLFFVLINLILLFLRRKG